MSQPGSVQPPAFRNRRGGLVFFGIVQVCLGLMAALMMGLMTMSLLTTQAPPEQVRLMAPAGFIYLVMATWLITLGVGSISARRWAWALTLASSWLWLAMGVLCSITMFAVVPLIMKEIPPDAEGAKWFIVGCMGIFVGLFMLLLPLAFVLFYRSPNVRATVQAVDPVRRWTDDVPLSVIAYALLMFFASASMLMWAFMFNALPVGTWVIKGVALKALILVFSALSLFIAVGFLRLLRVAWWTALVLLLAGAAYSAFFMYTVEWPEFYRGMELPVNEQQIILAMAMYTNPVFMGAMAAAWVAYFVWLLYVRKFFFGPRPEVIPAV